MPQNESAERSAPQDEPGAERRFEHGLRNALTMPPQPHVTGEKQASKGKTAKSRGKPAKGRKRAKG